MPKPILNEIELGLTDEDEIVRVAFAGRNDLHPAHAQIERGLADKQDAVRWTFVSRRDGTPTHAQIEHILANENVSFGAYLAWHSWNVKMAPDAEEGAGMASDRRRPGFDRRQQYYGAYANCARIFSRRTKSEIYASPDGMDKRLFDSIDAR